MKVNYEAWDVSVEDFPQNGSLFEQMFFVLRFASLAPSGHNSQPWEYFVGNDYIDLLVNKERSLAQSDPTQRILSLSFGACLQNILVAAEYFGMQAHWEYFLDNTEQVVRIFLNKSNNIKNVDENHLIHQIIKRVSSRGAYKRTPISDEFVLKINEIKNEKAKTVLVSELYKKEVVDLILGAQVDSMEDDKFRAELSEYIKSDFTKEFVGMPGFTIGVPPPVSVIASWLIKNFNLSKASKAQDKKLFYKQTPAILLISTEKDDKISWLEAGRVLEETWLLAESFGMKCSVFASVTQLPVYREKLMQVTPDFTVPQILLRVGYPEKEVKHSPRFTVNSLLKKN
jgi:hypothetical protein